MLMHFALKPYIPKQKGYNLFLNYFGNEIVNYELKKYSKTKRIKTLFYHQGKVCVCTAQTPYSKTTRIKAERHFDIRRDFTALKSNTPKQKGLRLFWIFY